MLQIRLCALTDANYPIYSFTFRRNQFPEIEALPLEFHLTFSIPFFIITLNLLIIFLTSHPDDNKTDVLCNVIYGIMAISSPSSQWE